jgi:hypothetical protein
MSVLQYRSSYRDRLGTLVHVYSDYDEPELEAFDEAVAWPAVLLPNNDWLLSKPLPRPVNEKRGRSLKSRPEREDRETHETFSLKGP